MVETRAQAMANERIDKIENHVHSLQTAVKNIELELKGISNQIHDALPKGK